MSIEISYINDDMSEGVVFIQKDPFTNKLLLNWEEVDEAVSLLLAHRELMQTTQRIKANKQEVNGKNVN
jgi:hypothetical protein